MSLIRQGGRPKILREKRLKSDTSMDVPPIVPSPAEAGSRAAGPVTFSPNELVADRYRIVRFIGQGGMGEVYEADDLELRQRLALKTVRPEIALDQQAIERFKREIRIARKVTHPNVCRIFDLGHHRRAPSGHEITFLTMELLPGETLAERLRRTGPMSTAEALPLAKQITAGLAAAHAAGIVHRDLKADNIILVLSQDGQQTTRAVVTDFGLARVGAAADRLTELSTAIESIAGTPAYMAPEQVEGGKVTAASDIYSLGIVLYEIVTGALPFMGDSPLSTAVKRLKEVPPSPRSLVPGLDSRWDTAILRCLERDPADRFASAGDVVRALGGEAVTLRRRPQRLRLAITGALLVVVFTAAAIYCLRVMRKVQEGAPPIAAGLPAAPVKARRSVAVLGFKNLSGRADASWLSTALSEMLTTELAAGGKVRTIPGENIAQMKINFSLADADSYSKETLARIRTNLGADLVVLGSYTVLGKETSGQIRLDLRLQDAEAGETIASAAETGTETKLFELVSLAGAHLREKLGLGGVSAAEANMVKAELPSNPEAARLYAEGLAKLRRFDALAARELLAKATATDPQHALAHSALAAAWSALGYDAKAQEEAKRAFEIGADLSREDRLSIEGPYRETTHAWEKAIEIYRTLFNFFPDNLDYGLRLASAQTSAGKGKDALITIEALRKLPTPARDDPRLDLTEARAAEALGDFTRQESAAATAAAKAAAQGARLFVARARRSQGVALYGLGDYTKANALYEEAKRIFAEAGDRAGVAWTLNDTANISSDRGDLTGGKKIYEQALTIFSETGDKRGMAAAQNNIASVLVLEGNLLAAKTMFEKVLAVSREVGNKSGVGIALNNIAEVLSYQGDLPHAKGRFKEALDVYREIGDKNGVGSALNNIAAVLLQQGDLAGAKKTYEEALLICREIGNKSYSANCLNGLGEVLSAQGDLIGARKQHEEALEIENQLGEKGTSAEIRLALAMLSIEGGRPTEAEALASQAAEEFRAEHMADSEASARAVLARALLAQGKLLEAQKAIDNGLTLLKSSERRGVRLSVAITAARVQAALGRPAEAMKSLANVLAEAMKHGFVGLQFEARLALGEIEMKRGEIAAGRAHLEQLQKEATAKGFTLVARKAVIPASRTP